MIDEFLSAIVEIPVEAVVAAVSVLAAVMAGAWFHHNNRYTTRIRRRFVEVATGTPSLAVIEGSRSHRPDPAPASTSTETAAPETAAGKSQAA